MAIQIQGNSGVVGDVDGTAFRAHKVTVRPIDPGAFGHYRLSMNSGVMAAGLAAGSAVFQFRWTDATRLAVVNRVTLDGAGGIVAFAAGVTRFDLVVARSDTAQANSGTTATLTGNKQKLRTSVGATLLGLAQISATAALTAGTYTLDAQAIGNAVASVGATAGVVVMPLAQLFHHDGGASHPLVLAQNEGFIIRATVPATGTWTFAVTVELAEAAAY